MNKLTNILFFVIAILLTVSCNKEEEQPREVVTRAYLNCNSVVKGYETSCQLRLEAPIGTKYVAKVVEGSEWCTLTNKNVTELNDGEMTATEKGEWVYFTRNEGKEIRYSTIEVAFDNGYKFELDLRQTIIEAPESYDKSWNELPKYVPNDDYIYVTHSAMLNGEQRRNYTFCFDKTKRASLWVAYPQHKCYTSGSANRNNSDFGFDPSVDAALQANMLSSYRGPYDRGHQIPAADRKCSQEMMDQTFYATNMTPQYSNFNQKRWGYLEGKVRNWVCNDTLYVVTGAYFGGPYSNTIATSTTDRSGNVTPTPSHYFKVVLRTVDGNTHRSVDSFEDASQLQAIGIWLQHENSGDDISMPAGSVVSVKYIEEKTGFEFFNMLNPAIADKVKNQCEPSRWSGLK